MPARPSAAPRRTAARSLRRRWWSRRRRLRPADDDGDGLVGAADKCPAAAEDRDGFEDDDGCPDPDNDRDGIADAADKCPLAAEVINSVDDDDGCPDEGKSLVQLSGERIVIFDKVYFATGKDVILKRSFPLLQQVARLLRAHPEIAKLRIEGHTDARGDAKKNVDLSQRRAGTVRQFLVDAGISADRLEAEGFGPSRPVAENKTEAGREQNRRVEFVVVEQRPVTPGT